MRLLFFMLFYLAIFYACKPAKVKSDSSNATDDNKKGVLKEPLDTSMISLRAYRSVSIDDLLSQEWNLDDVDPGHWNEIFWDSVADKRKYPGLYLFRDSRFTENVRTQITNGKWNLDKVRRELSLNYDNGTKKIYHIQQLALNSITCVWTRNEDSIFMKFSSDNLVHRKPEDDPFYFENNKWRIKPNGSESSTQIRERVRACVNFYALFFKDNRYRQSTDISFIGLPNCFVWYNGGLSLPAAIELDRKWINCFYSEDQAYKGYDMLKTFLETKTLKWPSRKIGWVGQTQAVLEQMRDSL